MGVRIGREFGESRTGDTPRLFVTGDLNVDYSVFHVNLGGITPLARPLAKIGGTAYNAAVAFRLAGFPTMVCGRVGQDREGDTIIEALETHGIVCHIDRSGSNPTCVCNITYFEGQEDLRTTYYWWPNANEYDRGALARATRASELNSADIIFTALHLYDQTGQSFDTCAEYFRVLNDSGARLIVDIAPHKLYERLDIDQLLRMVGSSPFMWIGEFRTLRGFVTRKEPGSIAEDSNEPTTKDMKAIAASFGGKFVVCRYGIGNISKEIIVDTASSDPSDLSPRETGYEAVPDGEKPGFGDRLTAKLIRQLATTRLLP